MTPPRGPRRVRRRPDGGAFAEARAELVARGQPPVVAGGAAGRPSRVRQLTEVLQRTTATGSVRAGRASSIRGEAAVRGVSEHRVRIERRAAAARSVARAQHRELTPTDLAEARAVGAGHGARVGAGALRPITVPDADGNFVQIVPRNAAQRAKLGQYVGAIEQLYRTGDASALAKFAKYRPQGIALGIDTDLIEALFLSELPDEFMSYLEAA